MKIKIKNNKATNCNCYISREESEPDLLKAAAQYDGWFGAETKREWLPVRGTYIIRMRGKGLIPFELRCVDPGKDTVVEIKPILDPVLKGKGASWEKYKFGKTYWVRDPTGNVGLVSGTSKQQIVGAF